MAAPVADIVRPAPRQTVSRAVASPVKPSQRFDEVLTGRRAKPAVPKPDVDGRTKPKPVEPAKVESPAAKSKSSKTKSTDPAADARPAEEHEDAEPTETDDTPSDDASQTQAADAGKPRTARSTNKTKSAQPVKADDGDGVEWDDEPSDVKATPTALPTVTPVTDKSTDDPEAESKPAKTPATDDKPQPSAEPQAFVQTITARQSADAPASPDAPDTSAVATVPADAPSKSADATPKADPAAKPSTRSDAAEAPVAEAETSERPKLKPHAEATADSDGRAAAVPTIPSESGDAKAAKPAGKPDAVDALAALQPTTTHDKPSATHVVLPAADASASASPQRTVAEENVDRIVTSVRGEMQKGGGTMQIRLDPPSLGQVQVRISVDDAGVLSASLQTSNDEATRLLSHNLQQLKTTLESAGVTVDRIQVKQAAPAEQSSSHSQGGEGDRQQNSGSFQDHSARQEQQRREMLHRMWAKLAGSGEPLDLVA